MSPFKLALALILAVAGLTTPAVAGGTLVNAGFWEGQTTWLGMTRPPERWCIQPEDMTKFLAGPTNKSYHCTYPVSVVSGGKIHFDGTCVDRTGLKFNLSGRGDYSPASVHMTATGQVMISGVAIGGDASVEAHFVSSDCPADAKSFSDKR